MDGPFSFRESIKQSLQLNKAKTLMFAVIRTGGKQYKVEEGKVILVEKLEGESGSTVDFNEVLLVSEGDKTTVGQPTVNGRSVKGEIVEQTLGKKLIAFKKIRRQGKQRKVGHRQKQTRVRITKVA